MKREINELNLLRAILCITIVLIHSMTSLALKSDESLKALIQFLQLFLLFATPSFIMLSEVILSHAYQNHLPKDFFKKRIQYILIPYIIFGIIDSIRFIAIGYHDDLFDSLWTKIIEGKWHGWFVIVIFKYYMIHYFCHQWLRKIPMYIPIISTFIISMTHSILFFHVDQYYNFWKAIYPFESKTMLLWWLFYFVCAYYIGQHYEYFMMFIQQYLICIILLLLIAMLWITHNFYIEGITIVTSYRYDNIIFTVLIFTLLIFSLRMFSNRTSSGQYNIINHCFNYISDRSYYIYLSHFILLYFIQEILNPLIEWPILYVISLCTLTIVSALVLYVLLAKLPYSEFIIGKKKKSS